MDLGAPSGAFLARLRERYESEASELLQAEIRMVEATIGQLDAELHFLAVEARVNRTAKT